ncbi:cell division protein [Loigolactobacillus backii]|uniref:septum site-determining protein MinC n=1 Tax=Loigolactobacillus backii TaxID=375175 RepID=UPI000C1CBEE4|nr:septum site-determining protein MinC [Loigolactobacillus backii]PIO83690.1 cell division protein [Loigolactobacillus backii]
MQDVILKGRQDGYQITLKQDSAISGIMTELTDLFVRLNQEKKVPGNKIINFTIKTENRLLTEKQQQQIYALIEQYPQFQVTTIEASVMTHQAAQNWKQQDNVHLNRAIIRSGQEVDVEGDVLFIGQIHNGGILKATGSVFLLGVCEGVVQAGFPDNEDALIVGDLTDAFQVRISGSVGIIADEERHFDGRSVAYINDLHLLDYSTLDNLKAIRPRLYNKIGEA